MIEQRSNRCATNDGVIIKNLRVRKLFDVKCEVVNISENNYQKFDQCLTMKTSDSKVGSDEKS